jgi:DNA modification methylase
MLNLFWQTTDRETVRLYQGDVLDQLRGLPSRSLHMCVTSPPYWGLRDYQTGTWTGGSPNCNHIQPRGSTRGGPLSTITGGQDLTPHKTQYTRSCPDCGATRLDNQLGSERTPAEYIKNMVAVFRELKRVLRQDGTLWLNMGDSYGTGSSGGGVFENGRIYDRQPDQRGDGGKERWAAGHTESWELSTGLPQGNMVGMPWRLAFALQADGWILRQDIIWSKPSPMPESATNRCCKSHEYLFLLTLDNGYFYDQYAIMEESTTEPHKPGFSKTNSDRRDQSPNNEANQREWGSSKAIKRSVWEVASYSYAGAHFATFPPKLIEPCILAGTSEKGCCPDCLAPWTRITERVRVATRPGTDSKINRASAHEESPYNQHSGSIVGNRDPERHVTEVRTVGWRPRCICYDWSKPENETRLIPCTVLDIFMGSGTTAAVSVFHDRRAVGLELSEDYLRKNAIPRIVGALEQRLTTKHLVPRPPREPIELGGN